jgi:hypothetical protein
VDRDCRRLLCVARKKPRSARLHASRALDAAFGDAPAFEAWLRRKKRISLAEPDLKPAEVALLARVAGRQSGSW